MTNKKNKYNNHKQKDNSQSQSRVQVNEEELAAECLHLHELLSNRTAKLRAMKEHELVYLLSTKWLQDWKDYVGYDQLVGDQQDKPKKDKKFGRRHPGKINDDIAASPAEIRDFYEIPKEMEEYQYLNEYTGEKRVKDDDYIAITADIWQALLTYYTGIQIRRTVRVLKSSTRYDDPLRCEVVLVNIDDETLEETIKKASKKTYNTIFPSDKFLLPTTWTFKQLQEFFAEYCGQVYGCSKIRIWKGYSYLPTHPLIQQLVESIKAKKYLVKGRLLTAERYEGYDIDDYIKSTHTLIVEMGQVLKTDETQDEDLKGYCQECVEKRQLTISCVCKEVVYCSNKCRTNDQAYHYNTCPQAFDSDDDQEASNISLDCSPLAGMENLGNTCYMNSTIQALLSLDSISRFFSTNEFKQHMSEKEVKENNCMLLTKFSKTVKALIQHQDSYAPWPLKSQVDYNLAPFRGDKQHDANDFLLNFLNVLNDHLTKPPQKAYHPLLQPLVGDFYSKVLCPNCQAVSENNEIFLQVSLPIKTRAPVKTFLYTVAESLTHVRRGKARLADNWKDMKAGADAKTSVVCLSRDNNLTLVDEEEEAPEKLTKGKGEIVFLKNVLLPQGEVPLIFGLVTIKTIVGTRMKSPYGIPTILTVRDHEKTLGTLWLQVIRHFFANDQQAVKYAQQLQQDYFCQIEQAVKEDSREQQEKKSKEEGEKEQKDETKEEEIESERCKKIVEDFNNRLQLFAEKLGIDIYVQDLKRNRNICKFCGKKCSNCELPKTFDEAFQKFFQDKYKEVRFQVFLHTSIQVSYSQEDKCPSGEPTIHDCLQLFAEPEELDEENAWYCDKCDSMALALKELHVKTFPSVLVLHLNRFKTVDNKKVKNSDPILYSAQEEFGGHKYQLCAVVVHEGSMEGGHYWCIARRGNQYYIFNDSKVTKTDKVFNRNAYILIYQLI